MRAGAAHRLRVCGGEGIRLWPEARGDLERACRTRRVEKLKPRVKAEIALALEQAAVVHIRGGSRCGTVPSKAERFVLYLSYTPRPPLNEFVERMWVVSGGQSPRRDRILPSGTIELVINLQQDQVRIDTTVRSPRAQTFSGAVVSGTYSAAFVIDAMQHAAMIGVHFRPAGASAVLGVPSVQLIDAHADVAALWGDGAARELRERLCTAPTHLARFRYLEGVLLERLGTRRRLHPVVPFALECFGPDGLGASVREVTRRSGLSHRRFLTIFRSEVGLPPKQFCRILRFQQVHSVAQRTRRINWTELALACGFCDQPHLNNEFRRLSGLTPTEYERAIRETRNLLRGHVAMS